MNESKFEQSGNENEIESLNYEKEIIEKIIPKDFAIPDLETVKDQTYKKRPPVVFGFEFKDHKYMMRIKFDDLGDGIDKVSIDFEDADKKELSAMFRTRIRKGPLNYRVRIEEDDNDEKIHCIMYHREVEFDYRGRGLGELGVILSEYLVKKIGQEFPEIKPDYFEFFTDSAAVIRLIIDQKWLEEQNLSKFKRKSKRNLGYHPTKKSIEDAKEVLCRGNVQEKDVKRLKEVHFYKKLK